SEPVEAPYYARDVANSSVGGTDKRFSDKEAHGGFDYIDGDRVEWTTGNKDVVIEGKNRMVIGEGGLNLWDATPLHYSNLRNAPAGWKSTVVENARKETVTLTESKSAQLAASFDATVGIDSAVSLGMSTSMRAGMDLNYFGGITADVKYADEFTIGKGSSYDHSKSSSSSAKESIELSVSGAVRKMEIRGKERSFKLIMGVLVAAGFSAGAIAGALTGVYAEKTKENKDDETLNKIGGSLEAARLATYGATIASWIAIAMDIARLKGIKSKNATEIKLINRKIELENNGPDGSANTSSLTLFQDKLIIKIDGEDKVMIDKNGLSILNGKYILANEVIAKIAVIDEPTFGQTAAGDPAVTPKVKSDLDIAAQAVQLARKTEQTAMAADAAKSI
ncbi:MAG: hypothetical protein ACJA0Z_003580, partial [Halioglobus sp.]